MNLPTRVPFVCRCLPALFLVFAATGFGLLSSSADIKITNQPASEGRPVTPAGSLVMDATTHQPAVGALPVAFVRSPDRAGPDGRGRYLVAVNSGYGLQFNSSLSHAQQSLAVIDLDARPTPSVVQNIYFPAPQSVNVGAAFSPRASADGSFTLYASGGFENKIWMFRLRPGATPPVAPTSPGPDTKVDAPSIDVSGFATSAATPRYNDNHAPVYPSGLAVSDDGETLFVANNLDDSLGIVTDLDGARRLERVELAGQKGGAGDGAEHFTYPYAVVALPRTPERGRQDTQDTDAVARGATSKVYVSCWNDASVAVVDLADKGQRVSYIPVERHPTAMVWDGTVSRLYVVNSNADSVSVIDTTTDRVVERISVRLTESAPLGSSPEGLALSADGRTLYVADAHSNSVAVVSLSANARGSADGEGAGRSVVRGFIPTGQYPSALALAGGTLYVGNGKGTGVENSSLVVNDSGRVPNSPNDRFPAGAGRAGRQGGEYSVAAVVGNISAVPEPGARELAGYTLSVMRNDALVGPARRAPFGGRSPIKHVIYIIKENRTYDQLFGDVGAGGDGTRADGDSSLAIFGAGYAARKREGVAQDITPNHRALALRFGLFDRFFVNAEASADGHNWSDAAFSSDYTDKAFRLNYSNRGRTYDFEGFNRLPNFNARNDTPPLLRLPATAGDIADFMRRFVPYLSGRRDVAEPETLYLWDAAARAALTYRNYGEFVATVSEAEVAALNANRTKSYPDLSPVLKAFPTKKALEGHHSTAYPSFDLLVPDSMTTASYQAARESKGQTEALVSGANPNARLRGKSRVGIWLEEFQGFVAAREAGRGDPMPNLSIMQFPGDHTEGVAANKPTPQFHVADNDYALGRLVEAVSNSPYWKDTAIFVVEDDAQDGPDHVDCHRSVALVISAYNREGALVHEFHNTVSLVRTIEMLLGFGPLNQLDSAATPVDLFRAEPDLRPYKAALPDVSLDNLVTPAARDAASAYWMRRTAEQDMTHPDAADPRVLNGAIWFSVRGASSSLPESAHLPAVEALRGGVEGDAREEDERRAGKVEVAARAARPKRRVASDLKSVRR
ncbi:MAG TPA: alkaline phosphatase family protein [Pyrinomonadaceae bacterium]|jgi:YVTN family beta-propeller protein|nr:alkaline phosphatase family protein [Pyrinomonadaceae bacterium]